MTWHKRISPGAARGGWKDDFPLDPDLPNELVLDLTALREPIHPMFVLRCRVFIEWHRQAGRNVEVQAPADAGARQVMEALALDGRSAAPEMPDVILPATNLREYLDVENVAERAREILTADASPTMAAGECGDDEGSSHAGASSRAR